MQEIEDELDLLMSSYVAAVSMPTKHIQFARVKSMPSVTSGKWRRTDKTEMVGPYNTKVYSLQVCVDGWVGGCPNLSLRTATLEANVRKNLGNITSTEDSIRTLFFPGFHSHMLCLRLHSYILFPRYYGLHVFKLR